ncbi:hypothetical protein RRG08_002101 [Elysia crispata]|uniref:Uncharacterized protein n=1 Tax=Elysia crispata TaxID=231223 RepID=A0AAE0ZKA0_9GAST|nr:hypothetical protein RRG08_002101 [Elysia crispata]
MLLCTKIASLFCSGSKGQRLTRVFKDTSIESTEDRAQHLGRLPRRLQYGLQSEITKLQIQTLRMQHGDSG